MTDQQLQELNWLQSSINRQEIVVAHLRRAFRNAEAAGDSERFTAAVCNEEKNSEVGIKVEGQHCEVDKERFLDFLTSELNYAIGKLEKDKTKFKDYEIRGL